MGTALVFLAGVNFGVLAMALAYVAGFAQPRARDVDTPIAQPPSYL